MQNLFLLEKLINSIYNMSYHSYKIPGQSPKNMIK